MRPCDRYDKNPPTRPHTSIGNPATCRVEAVLSIDSRGQIVLPKEVRRRAHLQDGDKLALVSWMNQNEVCCLALIRTGDLSSEISGVMHSLFGDKE